MVWDPEKAEVAAGVAEQELGELSEKVVRPLSEWWLKHYLKTGHRRLGRILVEQGKHYAGQEATKKTPKKAS